MSAASCARDMSRADAFRCDRRGGPHWWCDPWSGDLCRLDDDIRRWMPRGGEQACAQLPVLKEFEEIRVFEHFERFCWGPAAKSRGLLMNEGLD